MLMKTDRFQHVTSYNKCALIDNTGMLLSMILFQELVIKIDIMTS